MESYIRKKEVVQALIRAGKAEHLLRLEDLKEGRESGFAEVKESVSERKSSSDHDL